MVITAKAKKAGFERALTLEEPGSMIRRSKWHAFL